MKPWKAVSLILVALAVVAAGYGLTLVRGGFSSLATPSAIEEFAATTARKMAVPSTYRQLRNPITPSTENIRAGMEHFSDHCATCHSNDGGATRYSARAFIRNRPTCVQPGRRTRAMASSTTQLQMGFV
jgi:hypothetical protein